MPLSGRVILRWEDPLLLLLELWNHPSLVFNREYLRLLLRLGLNLWFNPNLALKGYSVTSLERFFSLSVSISKHSTRHPFLSRACHRTAVLATGQGHNINQEQNAPSVRDESDDTQVYSEIPSPSRLPLSRKDLDEVKKYMDDNIRPHSKTKGNSVNPQAELNQIKINLRELCKIQGNLVLNAESVGLLWKKKIFRRLNVCSLYSIEFHLIPSTHYRNITMKILVVLMVADAEWCSRGLREVCFQNLWSRWI